MFFTVEDERPSKAPAYRYAHARRTLSPARPHDAAQRTHARTTHDVMRMGRGDARGHTVIMQDGWDPIYTRLPVSISASAGISRNVLTYLTQQNICATI